MELILVRHAASVDESAQVADPDRYLTGPGRAAARALAGRLEADGLRPGSILCSPLARAIQTAELIAAGLAGAPPVEVVAGLRPGSDPRALLPQLADGALLIGHEPHLSGLATVLTGHEVRPLGRAEALILRDGREQTRL